MPGFAGLQFQRRQMHANTPLDLLFLDFYNDKHKECRSLPSVPLTPKGSAASDVTSPHPLKRPPRTLDPTRSPTFPRLSRSLLHSPPVRRSSVPNYAASPSTSTPSSNPITRSFTSLKESLKGFLPRSRSPSPAPDNA